MKLASISTLGILLCCTASAQIVLFDDFNDGLSDPLKWNVTTPYADSSVREVGGYAEVVNRGTLVSASQFLGPLTVSGRLLISNNAFSNAKVVLRSDGSTIGAQELMGVALQVQVCEDTGLRNQLSLFTIGAPVVQSVSTDRSLSLNTWYDFALIDNGTSIQLFWDSSSVPLLELMTSWSPGGRVGFYNREGGSAGSFISAGGAARLDFLSVASAVPEPSAFGLAGAAIIALAITRNRRLTSRCSPRG
jgi:hypothetical protein